MARVERQELHCHDCGKYVQFDLDLELDGNHVLACPSCGHEHCRVVQNGQVSDTRWDTRNSPTDKGKANPVGTQVLKTGKVVDAPAKPPPAPINNSTATLQPPTQIIAPNGLPVFYVTSSTMTCTTQGIGVYQGQTTSGNVYLYMSWANAAAKTYTA